MGLWLFSSVGQCALAVQHTGHPQYDSDRGCWRMVWSGFEWLSIGGIVSGVLLEGSAVMAFLSMWVLENCTICGGCLWG